MASEHLNESSTKVLPIEEKAEPIDVEEQIRQLGN